MRCFSFRTLIGLSSAAVATALWACTASAPSSPYPDVATFCNAKAKAECQIAAVCAADVTQCQMVRTDACNMAASAATASGSRKYTPDNAQACIDALNGAYGGGHMAIPFAQLQGSGSIEDKCERVFSGNVDKLGTCTTDYDCASSRVCAQATPGSSVLVCADVANKNAGDPCADPGSKCATDTYCTVPDGGPVAKCSPAAQPGEACSAMVPCVSADRCVNGNCAVRAMLGGACSSDDDCPSAAPYCDPYANNICTTGLTFATLSADCRGYGAGMPPGGAGDAGGDAGSPPTGDAAAEATDGGAPDAAE
ncbi:MAG TPA: Dickkopf N-terminal cysteine-rich domain-containing protein [Polyangiaceae bacterium]|nr:Dickkopf N-terminal cysteine-rich domain-containing protein [Polyangiaceae bacterium]